MQKGICTNICSKIRAKGGGNTNLETSDAATDFLHLLSIFYLIFFVLHTF